MNKFIPLSVPNLKGNELKYVTHAIETEWVSTAGPYINDFENKIAEYVGMPNAVACQNGTTGLHLALLSCGIDGNDEVLAPTLTFIAAVNPIHYIGADPIFMDCDESLTMDPIKVREFCETECDFVQGKLINKKTKKHVKAMIIVHVFGNMADMEAFCEIAKEFNLKLIEDATEALGTYYTEGKYKGRFAGTFGDIGVYSFNGNKIITTGGGGMIVSKHPDLLERCRYLSTQAKDDSLYFIHGEVGYNYRMTNIQAALGLAQLEQLEAFIQTKKENYDTYRAEGLKLLDFKNSIRPNYWFYSLITDHRDEIISELEKQKIQLRPIWKLIHTLKPYLSSRPFKIEKALDFYEKIVNIPCSSNLTEEDAVYVADKIKKFNQNRR